MSLRRSGDGSGVLWEALILTLAALVLALSFQVWIPVEGVQCGYGALDGHGQSVA